eukprot:CAMPEP_0172668926 /NCGR_PEP_ID=MMETSP1074-20121228/9363_1 /TAXON_ID=2916 /ORGANISM="Ceratium fusus, Strain PA161109" /LENGTH=503 /DNA_ID=CAMNT_0013485639 /DNA_START=62 /DNA_END=1570 /DNA_ORIENTATION=+
MLHEAPNDGPEVEPVIDVFLTWLQREHGVDLKSSGLEIRKSPRHGVGVFATRNLLPGTTVARIPFGALLHSGKVMQTEFGKRVMAVLGSSSSGSGSTETKFQTVSPEELLWLYMIWGRNEPQKCPWWPYLQSLPVEDPLAWMVDKAAQCWLHGTAAAVTAHGDLASQRARHAAVVSALETANPDFFSARRFNFEKWLWARSCCLSRAFKRHVFPEDGVPTLTSAESDLMCPLLDAFNHSQDSAIECRSIDGLASLVLPQDAETLNAGMEVFISYGRRLNNSKLISLYGLAFPRNPNDSIDEISFEFQTTADAATRAAKLLAAAIPHVEDVAVPETRPTTVCVCLARGLRCGLSETPSELLRVASWLVLGEDFQVEEADCAGKQRAAAATAKVLRHMLRRTAPLVRLACHLRARRSKDAAVLLRFRSPSKRARWWPHGHPGLAFRGYGRVVKLPWSAKTKAAALYAHGQRKILREVANCANTEAEMAQIAGMMELQQEQGHWPD